MPCSDSDPPPSCLLIWALGGPARVAYARDRVAMAFGGEPRSASAELPGLVARLLADDGPPARIGVAVGPGSFTGIKVSLAFARGLATGWGRPLLGVDPLAAMALAHGGEGAVAAVDSLRGEAMARRFRSVAGWPEPDGAASLRPWAALAQEAALALDPDLAGPAPGPRLARDAVLAAAMALLRAERTVPPAAVWSRPSGAEEAAARKDP